MNCFRSRESIESSRKNKLINIQLGKDAAQYRATHGCFYLVSIVIAPGNILTNSRGIQLRPGYWNILVNSQHFFRQQL